MTNVLTTSERIVCPHRGEIDVEWCLGCPRRVSVEHAGSQTMIVCDADGSPRSYHEAFIATGPFRDVPDIWKTA